VLGAIIALTVAGTGMLMLAFVFQGLATRKPDLDVVIGFLRMLSVFALVTLVSYGVMPQRELATRDTYGDGKSPVGDMVIAAVATVYTSFLLYMRPESTSFCCLASCTRLLPRSTSRRAANEACVCSDRPRRCCSA
jgi:hypothetical protein